MTTTYTNYEKLKEAAYSSIRNFIEEPNSSNKIITAPTQVGKTASIIELLKHSHGWLSVVSCDNKTDQLSQIFSRFHQAGLNVFYINKCKKRNTKKIISYLSNNRNVVIVLLNNSSQIKNLSTFITELFQKVQIKNYLCIHDEADTVNKIDIIDETDEKVPESHREWNLHFSKLGKLFLKTLRVWVTATCDNCSNLKNIQGKDIIVLPSPVDYAEVNRHVEWKGNDETALIYEVERINLYKTGEVILYCYTHLIHEQVDKAKKLQNECNCITVVYNSGTKYIFGYPGYTTFNKGINEVLKDLKQTQKAIVIFGSEMMGRGISFVGSDEEQPLAATVLFHKDTSNTSAVNMTQKFGRITGTARPDLKTRTVYCTNKAYNDYINYLFNQKTIYKNLCTFPELNMTEILKLVESKKINRKVDRPSLKKVNQEYKDNCDSGYVYGPVETVKMHRLVKSWMNINNISEIAKLFRIIIESDGKLLSSKVKHILEKYGDNYYNNLVAPVNNRWDTVFRKDKQFHYIKDEAMAYYNSLL